MVNLVRRALAITVLVLAAWAAPAAGATNPSVPTGAATSPSTSNPTRTQIAKAIKQAEASESLWATVNICNSKRYPNAVGIRGQMPSLGFPAWLSMKIQLNWWSGKQFVPATVKLVRLGRWSHGLQQGGARFDFPSDAGLFDASVQFIWRRSGKLLGRKTLATTAGHPNADFGSPAHYSAARCRIG
jgi:hypothetical protein